MADFKQLHDQWKKAKKEAKDWYGNYEKLFMEVTHEDVKLGAPKFPAFKMELGPSLENIHRNKDVEKSKGKARAAVKQYEKDIENTAKAVCDQKRQELVTKAKNGPAIMKLALEKLDALEKVRHAIAKELK